MPVQLAQPIPLFRLNKVGQPFLFRAPKSIPQTPIGTKFYEMFCDPVNGDNMNGGSSEGAAIYTSVNGNWDTTNRIFTPTDGTNPVAAGVRSGQCMSVYLDGSSTPAFLQLIVIVENAVNGRIYGNNNYSNGATPPSTLATGRSVRVGGAWKGSNAAVGWPMASPNNLTTLVGNPFSSIVRCNWKNNALYSISAAIGFVAGGSWAIVHQGYSISPGDGGRATLDGGSNAINLVSTSSPTVIFRDFVFSNNGSTGANYLFSATGNQCIFWNCIFHDSRGGAVNGPGIYYECEFYNLNTSGTASLGILLPGSTNLPITVINCYFHDCGTGTIGINYNTGGAFANIFVLNSIFDSLGSHGIVNSINSPIIVVGSDFYFCGGSGIKGGATNPSPIILINNNFIGCGQFGIDAYINTTQSHVALLANNKFGSGSLRNRSGNINPQSYNSATLSGYPLIGLTTLGGIMEVGSGSYVADASPYRAAATGDFSLVLAEALGVGRGNFTQTGSGKSGTLGFPDVGSAQSNSVTNSQAWQDGNFTLPRGYIGYFFIYSWAFTVNSTFAVVSGSLPPGLVLIGATQSSANIVGYPTTVGTYDFVIRATVGTSTGDATFHITIVDDPDQGSGGVGGG